MESAIESRIRDNLDRIKEKILDATIRAGRSPASVRLVAVTKKNPATYLEPLIRAGQLDLGENYPQELWEKAEAVSGHSVRWHLIGHLQSNKARRTVPLLWMIHSVDSLKLLQRLNSVAEGMESPPRVCLQANCSREVSKHGWEPQTLLNNAEEIANCRSIPIVGLMTMAGYGTSNDEARPTFVRLRQLAEELRARSGLALPELSMGMSGDFEAAIEEGATLVRVGSALFEGLERS